MRDTIYRIENNKGEGCYKDIKTKRIIDWSNDFNPLPEDDKGIERQPNRNEICGFVSLEQAERWFSDKEEKALGKLGYELKEIEIKEITAFGERQVLAIR